ncbi:MAG: S8 family serine peptidase, partial [Pirellulales bacterium]
MSLLGRYRINQPKPKAKKSSRSSGSRSHRTQNQIETLEVRDLMAADLGVELFDATETEDRFLSPIWFEQLTESSQEKITLGSATLAESTSRVQWNETTLAVYQDEWIVQLDVDISATINSLGQVANLLNPGTVQFEVISGLGLSGQILLKTTNAGMDAVSQWLDQNDVVESFEPNALLPNQTVPNDTEFNSLWGLDNTGQSGGTIDADIDATEAWEITTGTSGNVVAVIDTGIDYTHPDLISSIWVNPGEIAGNGIDDDENGFVDDIHGFDFINNDGDPMDDNSHGTHVAGTIAAAGNNSAGITGVAPETSVMALKFLGANGSGSTSDAIRALNYATMMKSLYSVNVVATNNSWGGGDYSQALYNAIKASGDADILFVAAAGNMGTNNDTAPQYPAGYGLDNVISVAATDHNDQLASFSNYGATSVDLAAPGVDILSTVPGGGYASYSGTSMATPHVSGVIALAYAVNNSVSMDQVKKAILGGVDVVDSLQNVVSTDGRLNAVNTLQQLSMVVESASIAEGETVGTALVDFQISFSASIDASSVDASDLQVNGQAANRYTINDSHTVTFHFNQTPLVNEGEQILTLGQGAIQRSGDALSVNAWSRRFFYDSIKLDVLSVNIGEGSVLDELPEYLEFKMNEPVDGDTLSVDNLQLSTGTVAQVELVDHQTIRYYLDFKPDDQTVEYQLAAGAVADQNGSPNKEFSGSFEIDLPSVVHYVKEGPIALPQYGMIDIPLVVEEDLQIVDVDVLLDISHDWVSDLDVSLIAPDGTVIPLFAGIGGNSDDLIGTVLDDEAGTSIQAADAPFTGHYRPVAQLSVLDSMRTAGTWKLRVADSFVSDVGTLHQFGLKFEVASPLKFEPIADVDLSGSESEVLINLNTTGGNSNDIVYSVTVDQAAGEADVPVLFEIDQAADKLKLVITEAYHGEFVVEVTAADGQSELTQSFTVNVSNVPVQLESVEDQVLSSWQEILEIDLEVINPDGNGITFEVTAMADSESELTKLDREYDFIDDDYLVRSNYAFNTQGQGEKYVRSATYQYYYMTSDGTQTELYQWNGSFGNSSHIATLDQAVFDDPSLLHNASDQLQTVEVSIENGQLVLTAPEDYVGMIDVVVSVSDGNSVDEISFTVEVLEVAPVEVTPDPIETLPDPVETVPDSDLIAVISDQTVSRGQGDWTLDLTEYEIAQDAETLEASIYSPEAAWDEELGLYADAWLVNANYGLNAQGQGEKYLRADNYSWYYLTLNQGQAELHQWTGSFDNNPVIATLDSSVYEQPSLLHDSMDPSLLGVSIAIDEDGVLSIQTDPLYVGSFQVQISAYQVDSVVSEQFTFAVVNQNVDLYSIEDQEHLAGQGDFTYQLSTENEDEDLTYHVEALAISDEQAFALDQEHQFVEDPFLLNANYGYNAYGYGEKFLRTADSQWYYILDNGSETELYYWNGAFGESEPIAVLDRSIFENPEILNNAQEDAALLEASVHNGMLSVASGNDFTGQVVVTVSISDGVSSDSEQFNLNIV